MPLLGGLPEIVTLHARLCSEMSIVGLSLYCNANSSLFFFDMSRPNSAFLPVQLPNNVSPVVTSFILSREKTLFVLGAGRSVLYRIQGSFAESAAWPSELLAFGPTFYNEPTDRLMLPTTNNSFVMWIGMESFWQQIRNRSATGFLVPPATRDGLNLFGFSSASRVTCALLWTALVMVLCVCS
jgi:hypothetical protein